MLGKLVIASLGALCLAFFAHASCEGMKMPVINQEFIESEICGEKGDKTIEALKTDETCAKEMEGVLAHRKKICDDYEAKKGSDMNAAIEAVQVYIAEEIKKMTPEAKKDICRCLSVAYKKAHGVDFSPKE